MAPRNKTLTKRKEAWVDRRRPEVVRGSSIVPSAAVEARYYKQLKRLIDQMTEETERRIKKLMSGESAEEYFAMDASIASQARVLTNYLFRKFNSEFSSAAKPLASSFANQSNKVSGSAVHKSLKELSGGLSLPTANLDGQLKDILSATISENVDLIKSIPQKYLLEIKGAVMRSIAGGEGENLITVLRKQKKITERRAQLIAMDQTRKAMNNLSKGRLKNLGMDDYEWIHVASAEPRADHVALNGKVFSWTDPERKAHDDHGEVIPGQRINCHCRFRPVIKFEN
jgi:SPP1 gp7 family putative phage head morphogenesis protein